MGGGGSSSSPTAAPSISSLRVSTAVLGRCVPWLFGTPRVSPNLIQHDDFTAIPHVERSQAGGKGGGGGGSDTTTYTYTAAIIMAMCRGPITGVGRVWIGKEQKSTQQLNLDVYTGTAAQTAHPHWLTKHPDNALAYRGMAYTASAAYDLGDGGEVPSHNFEVFTPTRISNSNPDANPAVVLQELIANKVDGLGLDVAKIGNLQLFSDFCMANGIWISPCYDEQQAAHELVERIAEIGHSAVVVSEGKIKLIPYADTAASGNGATFTPNNSPVYDLGEDDFLGNGGQPIKISRSSQADADNHFQLTYYDRANEYNEATVEAQDQAHIEKFGLRTKEPDEYHEICDGAVAQKLVSFKKDRSLAIRNTYEFQLSLRYALLEPMDIVTLTYAPDGLDRLPVRIVEIEEDDNGDLSIKAEECPLGSQSPTQQASQSTLAGSVDFNVGAGNVNAPVLFEPSLQLTRGSTEIWASVSGGQNWGGAQVWVSLDNATYQKIGVVSAPSRQGVLTAALLAGSSVDTVNMLKISTDMSRGALLSATEQEALDLVTLCYADGELLAYKNAQLTGVNAYDLSYLVRGLYGTDPVAHSAGTKFARLDESTFKYPYKAEWVGRTVYLKFVSYNKFGAGEQSLADVTAYPYTINGAPLKPVANLGFEKPWIGSDAKIRWDLVDGAARYDVEVWAGTPTALVRKTDTVTEGRFVYSLDMARIDGGTWRTMVFKVRPISITGNKGQWAQVMASNPQIGALTGFKFSSGMLAAYLEYAKPTDADFAGVRVWLGTDPNFATIDSNCVYDGDATLLTLNKQANGAPLDGGVTYYVKLAGYDTFGKDGLTISAALGFTVYSVSAMAKDLSESNLAAALRNRIDLVDGSGAGSVTARISTETTNRLNQISTESSNRAAAIAAEAATRATTDAQLSTSISTITASTNSGLANNTAAIQAEQTARSNADTALGSRIDVVVAQSTTDRTNAAAAVSNEATARTNADSALSSQITTLTATVNGNNSTQSAAIASEQTTRANADGTLSGRIDAVTATQANDRATLNASIQSEASARTTADNALTTRVDAVVATANTDRSNLTAAVNNEATARANADSAQAQQITTLAASLSGSGNLLPNAGFDVDTAGWAAGWKSVASDDDGTFTRDLAGSDWQPVGMHTVGLSRNGTPTGSRDFGCGVFGEAYYIPIEPNARYCLSGYLASHRSQANMAILFYDETRNTMMAETHSARTSANASGGKDLTAWERKSLFVTAPAAARWAYVFVRQSPTGQAAPYSWVCRPMLERVSAAQTMPSPWSPPVAGISAVIADVRSVMVAADNVNANAIQTVQTQTNNNTASVQAQASSINGLQAQYTVKIDVNGYVSGYGLATTLNNDTPQSSFIINADKFGVGAAGKGTSFPFVVDTIKNVVGINGDLAVDGTFRGSAIVTNSITGDKVKFRELSGNHMQLGSLGAELMMVGASSNMLVNAGFESDLYGWGVNQFRTAQAVGFNLSADWAIESTSNKTLYMRFGVGGNGNDGEVIQVLPCEPNKTYIATAYTGNHRSSSYLHIWFFDSNGNVVESPARWSAQATSPIDNGGGKYLSGYYRNAHRAKAPSNAVKMQFSLYKYCNNTAGDSDSYLFMARPYLGECLPNQTELPPWDAAGATVIGAGNIKTDNLAAISANLGVITGGSLNINNRFQVNADGTATIRSGTTGQRTEMDNQQVRVYDTNGVLRVRLGIW